MSIPMALAKCMANFDAEARKATVYLGPRLVVSICRRHKHNKRSRMEDFVVKVGAPNYEEREFIKRCKKAGEPLPLNRVQLKFWPVKKK